MKVEILNDIETRDQGTFFARSARIEYDAKAPKSRKIHQLFFQQGNSYGMIGDKCVYLTHDELLGLAAHGKVKISR